MFVPKIDKFLFAATKVNHVTPEKHAPMEPLLNHVVYHGNMCEIS